MNEAFLKFRKVEPVKFGELIVGLKPNYEEVFWLILHNLVEDLSYFPNEPKARQNESA